MQRALSMLAIGVCANALVGLPAFAQAAPEVTLTRLDCGTSADRAATLASIDRFKKIAANLKATVVIQHDARDVGKLPAFPAAAK